MWLEQHLHYGHWKNQTATRHLDKNQSGKEAAFILKTQHRALGIPVPKHATEKHINACKCVFSG